MKMDLRLALGFEQAEKINEENLKKILDDNQGTVYGKKYAFSTIRTQAEYCKRVPLSDYTTYERYIDAMYHRGEKGVLTNYPIVSYCNTSGTEGNAKRIPISFEALTHYGGTFETRQDELFRSEDFGKRLFVNTFRTDLESDYEKTLLFSEIYYRYLFENGYIREEEWIGGRDFMFIRCDKSGSAADKIKQDKKSKAFSDRRDQNQRMKNFDMFYAKLWAAVLTEDLVLLEAIFLYDVLHFFSYMEKHGKSILEDIKRRQISPKQKLPKKIRDILLNFPYREERIALLEREFEKGFENIAVRIWPKLKLISGISSQMFFVENEVLQKYIGDIPKYFLCYCASECYMGTPIADDDFCYVLLPGNAFYEFIPFSDSESAGSETTLLLNELEPGKSYEIVVTNFSGLYRYRMGDVLKVTGYLGESPVYEFQFRKNQAINIAGEKTSESQLELAIKALAAQGVQIEEFCFGASLEEMPGKYLLTLVLGENSVLKAGKELALHLDQVLGCINVDYKDLRDIGSLGQPYVRICSREEYEFFIKQNLSGYRHNKPVHMVTKAHAARE